jgi:outer membrane protein assembly factor BamB
LLVNPSTPPVITPPVISNNNSRLYVALRNNTGTLYSIWTSNGKTAQQRSLGAKIDKSVGVGVGSVPEGMVYVATNDKLVYALYGNNLLATPKWTTISFAPDEAYSSTPAASPDGSTVYIGSFDDKLYAINAENGTLKWDYPAAGNVQSTPYVDSSNIVYFGSDIMSSADRRNVYALYGLDKSEKWRFETTANVLGTPAVSPDGTVYIGSSDSYFYCINQFANPKGFRNLRVTSNSSNSIVGRDIYDSITQQLSVTLDSGNEYHWLNGAPSQNKKLWAVRIEVTRDNTIGVPGEYTLKTWIRQCNNNTDCDNIYSTFFEDTRVDYPVGIKPPLLTQTIQLPNGDHDKFGSFLFGFTSARDAADDQIATIRKFQLSFIRPNDPTAERNPLIPISDPDPNLP